MEHERHLSMRDVAARAGVSVGTVSNVLNWPAKVSPTTAHRVRQAIDDLGWVPNEGARQLRTGHLRTIGMIVLDIANPYFAEVALGVEDVLYNHGFSVFIGNSNQQPEREERLLRQYEEHRVRGIILAPIAGVNQYAKRLRRRGIPVVMLDRAYDSEACGVGVDDVEGGRLAATHLVERGHRRLAFVGGPMVLAQVRDRRAGAERALRSLTDDGSLLTVTTPALAIQPGLEAAEEILALPPATRPTAVFAANDLLAIGLLQGFVSAGVRVPEDIALIGYDDIEFAASSAVPLSSIHQPRRAMGAQAAALLIDQIKALDEGEEHFHQAVRMTPVLVARRSTDAPPR